jgi:DnaJ-class molecular chaperone
MRDASRSNAKTGEAINPQSLSTFPLWLLLAFLLTGVTLFSVFVRAFACPSCKGDGMDPPSWQQRATHQECKWCDGTGRVTLIKKCFVP